MKKIMICKNEFVVTSDDGNASVTINVNGSQTKKYFSSEHELGHFEVESVEFVNQDGAVESELKITIKNHEGKIIGTSCKHVVGCEDPSNAITTKLEKRMDVGVISFSEIRTKDEHTGLVKREIVIINNRDSKESRTYRFKQENKFEYVEKFKLDKNGKFAKCGVTIIHDTDEPDELMLLFGLTGKSTIEGDYEEEAYRLIRGHFDPLVFETCSAPAEVEWCELTREIVKKILMSRSDWELRQ